MVVWDADTCPLLDPGVGGDTGITEIEAGGNAGCPLPDPGVEGDSVISVSVDKLRCPLSDPEVCVER